MGHRKADYSLGANRLKTSMRLLKPTCAAYYLVEPTTLDSRDGWVPGQSGSDPNDGGSIIDPDTDDIRQADH